MSESREKRPAPVGWTPALAALIALPMIYLLGLGPADWLHSNPGTPEPLRAALRTIYAPADWLADAIPGAKQVLDSYIDLWD